ncbi:hypothetical protein DBR06_SOUSAS24610003, partial [Sousa chinensis]
ESKQPWTFLIMIQLVRLLSVGLNQIFISRATKIGKTYSMSLNLI